MHLVAALTLIVLPAIRLVGMQYPEDWEHAAIQYAGATPHDSIARLQKRIDSGQVTLAYDNSRGYLPAVLKALDISPSSQLLVFSKTSFQRDLISPKSPRALYFNDSTYIGWVLGGPVLEVATADPQLGSVYYILLQKPREKPRFFRHVEQCLECHGGAMSNHVPGHIMRSVYPDAEGSAQLDGRSYLTTDASPLAERWGGWYVTGKHGRQRHLGNCIATRSGDGLTMDMDQGANVTDLRRYFDPSPYLTPNSDIVALMVMEHQTHLQNLITKASYQARMALSEERKLNAELRRPPGYRAEDTMSRIRAGCEPLIEGLLFAGEYRLTDPIQGTSGFAEQFSALGPRDRRFRSLRQLDLKRRLLRYPCSYTIYSEAFDAMPSVAKDYVYRRLWQVLKGQDTPPDLHQLTASDRKAILEILLDTKSGFATAVKRISLASKR